MPVIGPDVSIRDLVRDNPKAAKVLAKHGMMCTGCGGFESEKLRHAAKNHGVPLDALIREIKQAIKSGS